MVSAKQVKNSIKPKSFKNIGGGTETPLGAIGYDNVRDDIEKVKKVREISTPLITSVNDLDIKPAGTDVTIHGQLNFPKQVVHSWGIVFTDFDGETCHLEKNDTKNAFVLECSEAVAFLANGDNNDYAQFQTPSNVPELVTKGNCDLNIKPDTDILNVGDTTTFKIDTSAANITTISGGTTAADQLKLKGDNVNTRPFMTLDGGTNVVIDLPNGRQFTIRQAGNNVFQIGASFIKHKLDADIIIENEAQDKDIIFRFDAGGVTKNITIDASGNILDMGDTSIITTGNVSCTDLEFGATGQGLTYGGIYVNGNGVATAFPGGAGVPAQFLFFGANEPANRVTPDFTQNWIMIDEPGDYLVTCSIHCTKGAAGAILGSFDVMAMGGTIPYANLHTHRNLAGGGVDHGSVSISGIVTFAGGETLELWITNLTNGVAFTIEDVTLSVVKIGG